MMELSMRACSFGVYDLPFIVWKDECITRMEFI